MEATKKDFSGFHRLNITERLQRVAEEFGLSSSVSRRWQPLEFRRGHHGHCMRRILPLWLMHRAKKSKSWYNAWWNKAPSASMWPRWNLPNCATRDYELSWRILESWFHAGRSASRRVAKQQRIKFISSLILVWSVGIEEKATNW